MCFLIGLIADKLASYEYAFYTAGSMMLLSGAVQFILLCFKSKTKRELVNASMVVDSEEISENSQYKETDDHKEYLGRLYVESTLRKNCKNSASVESMKFF